MTYHASAPPAQASSAHAHFHHQTGGHLNTTVLCPYPQVAAVRFPEHQRNGIPIVHYHCASPINRVPFYPPRSGESNGMSIPQNHSVCRGHLRCIHLPIFSHPQTAGNRGLEDRRQWATASSYVAQPSNQHIPSWHAFASPSTTDNAVYGRERNWQGATLPQSPPIQQVLSSL
jgi:hypothetical protein